MGPGTPSPRLAPFHSLDLELGIFLDGETSAVCGDAEGKVSFLTGQEGFWEETTFEMESQRRKNRERTFLDAADAKEGNVKSKV